jgi:integrase
MGRRGNGEGSVFQRKDGRWTAIIDLGYRDGKRYRKSVYGTTRKEVSDELTRQLRSQQLGLPVGPGRLTVEGWLKKWLEQQQPPCTKPKTYTAYENHVRIHLVPALGIRPLLKLQPQDVREFMRSKAEAGFAPTSIRDFRATLRAALNVAVHDGLIARNVAMLAKPPRLEKPERRVFTLEEARRFLEVVKGHRLEAIFTVALALGMREGEILGLRWQDLDLIAGRLQVACSLQRVKMPREKKSKLVLLSPKSEKSSRLISPLPQITMLALQAHRMRQEQERIACGANWHDTGMVFTTGIGTMLDPRNMVRSFYAILNTPDPSDPEPDRKKKRKLLPRLRFHDLRHSAATLLLAQGVHPRYIMELLGHSSITVTMNTYGHVLEEMKSETARQIDAVFGPVAVKLAVKPSADAVQ